VILKCVSWNLLKGGIDAGNDTRMRRQMSRVAAEQPDVVMLQFSNRRAHSHVSGLVFSVADMSVTLTGGPVGPAP
jgi:endonuclease/exonuclease/phosphatase family metal-dependent hydrolase